MKILSIQSHVAYGYVGNRVAGFALERLGDEVNEVLTVNFSNSTVHGKLTGVAMSPEQIKNIYAGLKDLNVISTIDLILTGFIGSKEIGEAICELIDESRKINPKVQVCVDPIFGDYDRPGDGIFVKPEIPAFFRDILASKANILTPNQFELAYLTEQKIVDLQSAINAAREYMARSSSIEVLLVTSLMLPDFPNHIHMLAVEKEHAYLVQMPLLKLQPKISGAGDLTAALFAHHRFYQGTKFALHQTAAGVHHVLELTSKQDTDAPVLQLIQGQDFLLQPQHRFQVKEILM